MIAEGTIQQPYAAVPYRLRVGVTGHRRLPDDPALAAQVRVALRRIQQLVPATEATSVRLTALSPLAEGADRLVAAAVLETPDALLEAYLPLPVDQYLTDFETEQSRGVFRDLLARASAVVTLPPARTRDTAYARAGHAVVERSEVLLALWDGSPARGYGGTGDVVAWARARKLPLFWIETAPPYTLHEEPGDGFSIAAFHQLDAFNRTPITAMQEVRETSAEIRDLLLAAEEVGIAPETIRTFSNWITPYFMRADAPALAYQRRFQRYSAAFFVFAAGWTLTPSLQGVFFPDEPQVQLLALVFIALTWFVGYAGRDRFHLHRHWIIYRALAEQLRSRFFLALVGDGALDERAADRSSITVPSEEWAARVFAEAWRRRPRITWDDADAGMVARFLAKAWIEDQIGYCRARSTRQRGQIRRLGRWTHIAFLIGIISVVINAFGLLSGQSSFNVVDPSSWRIVFKVLAIVVPAVAAALNGIGAQREYARNAARFQRTAELLEVLRERMENAPDLGTIQAVAEQVEALLLEESRGWLFIMQYQDLRAHA